VSGASEFGVARFRARLLAGMTFVVIALTACGLYLVERSVTADTEHDLQRAFDSELALLRTARGTRHAVLVERCRALVRKPRIHAALEDNALDLLYPSARDELGDVEPAPVPHSTRPRFYRFLDAGGAVIPPLNASEVGELRPGEEKQLGFSGVPAEAQTGAMAASSRYSSRRSSPPRPAKRSPLSSRASRSPRAAVAQPACAVASGWGAKHTCQDSRRPPGTCSGGSLLTGTPPAAESPMVGAKSALRARSTCSSAST
jgi:hypothetical protein